MKKLFSIQKGFTLIEMIVVVGILAILILVVIATMNPLDQIYKANDARRKSDLAQIQRALEAYYQDQGRYPVATSNKINGIDWGEQWSPYMNTIPADPVSPKRYYKYTVDDTVDGTGQAYRLYANLERGGKDPQACTGGVACSNVPAGVYCGGSEGAYLDCNFGVSSPNTSP